MINRIRSISSNIAIIINANWINAIGVIRSLALEQIPNISITNDPLGLGLFSNQTIGLKFPNYANSPDKLADFLLNLRRDLNKPGIIMVTDDGTLESLIRIDDQIRGNYLRTYPEVSVLDFILDKHNQFLSAKAAGVPVPFTMAPENTSDLDSWPRELFPCIIKGRRGKKFYSIFGFQAILIRHSEDLHKFFSNMDPGLAIIQEYIPGGDDQFFGYTSYFSSDGKFLAGFTSQKLEQTPRNIGVMRRGISNSEAKIDVQSLKWMEAVGYTGLSYIEYKLDMRDGKYKLIELNARSWLNQFMATLSGVNFPAIMYWSMIGKNINPVIEHKHGIEWVSHVEELLSVTGELLKQKFNLHKWINSLPKGKDVIFGWKDPLPGFIAPINAIRTYLKKRKENKKVFLKRLT